MARGRRLVRQRPQQLGQRALRTRHEVGEPLEPAGRLGAGSLEHEAVGFACLVDAERERAAGTKPQELRQLAEVPEAAVQHDARVGQEGRGGGKVTADHGRPGDEAGQSRERTGGGSGGLEPVQDARAAELGRGDGLQLAVLGVRAAGADGERDDRAVQRVDGEEAHAVHGHRHGEQGRGPFDRLRAGS